MRLAALLSLAAAVFCLHAQNDAKDPLVFDVASIKPTVEPCPPKCGLVRPLPGNRVYHAEGSTLRSLMTIAYSVTPRQISGGPSWVDTDRFDIDAKTPQPRTSDELHIMLGHLLEDRFQLKLKHVTREEPVWALTVAKGGSKLTAHDPGDKDYPPIGQQLTRNADGTACPTMIVKNATMNYFAFFLSRGLDRHVIDRTGLTERYDFNFQFLPDGARFGENAPQLSPECVDIFGAMPKQIGLRLDSAKGPVESLVIESVAKPSEN
jgi:uncharacterized protein (TIGR03435 family)